jgi:putative addiction module killer protein
MLNKTYLPGYNHGYMEIELEIYEAPSGKRPFKIWFENIRDALTKAKVATRLDRLKQGNFGDCKNVGGGVCELRVRFGPGIRIYYSQVSNKLVLLLCGGDKGSQGKDIDTAKEYLKNYQSREKIYAKK